MPWFSHNLSRNTFALLLSNSGSAVLSFLLSVLIGRVLGGGGLGIYAASLAWVFPISLIAEFGIGTLITREVAQSPQDAHAYLTSSILARLLIGGTLMILLWTVAPLLSSDLNVIQGIRIASPLVIILPFYGSFTAVFRARQIMQPIAWLNLGMPLSQVLLTALILMAGEDILTVLMVNTSTSAGQLVAAWLVYRLQFYQPTKRKLSFVPILRRAFPFAIAAILAALQTRINIIILEQFSGTAQVGFYAAAIRFVEAGRLIPHAFFDALFPLLAGLAADTHQLNRTFRWVLFGLIAFGVIFGLGALLFSNFIMQLTYGEAFAPSVIILQIAAWSLLPMLLKGGRTLYWYAQGQEQFVNRVTLFAIAVHFGIAFWLIPRNGAVGAAVASLAVETLAFTLLWLWRR